VTVRRAAASAVVALAAMVANGCGGDGDTRTGTGTAPSQTTSEPKREFVVGVVDDAVREPDRGDEVMAQLADAGFAAVRITSIWDPGETAPQPDELQALQRVVGDARRHDVRVYLSIYHAGSKTTPLTPGARTEFATYAAAVAREVPEIRDVIVGNEPNLNRFWMPQFGPNGEDVAAQAYLELLASTYDALKDVSEDVQVYGGALSPRGIDRPGTGRDTQSPTTFIRDLGRAYRASGRTEPLMDAFAFHPYADSSNVPPDRPHPNSREIGLADYDKLVGLLGEAFDGTAQPGSELPILYDEFGVETKVPPDKAPLYEDEEPPTTGVVDEQTQARYYARALELACRPTVLGILLFHSHDEPNLYGWQSGVYYVDGTPKTSLEPVRKAVAAARGCDAGA
jgi:hypothetical protein